MKCWLWQWNETYEIYHNFDSNSKPSLVVQLLLWTLLLMSLPESYNFWLRTAPESVPELPFIAHINRICFSLNLTQFDYKFNQIMFNATKIYSSVDCALPICFILLFMILLLRPDIRHWEKLCSEKDAFRLGIHFLANWHVPCQKKCGPVYSIGVEILSEKRAS